MEATTRKSIHPLVAVAAVSVTLFSLVGIGALTGLIPTSHSQSAQVETAAAEPAKPAVAVPPPEPVAAATVVHETKPAEKRVVHKKVAKRVRHEEKVVATATTPAAKVETPVTVAQNTAPAPESMVPPPPPHQPGPAIEPVKSVCHDCGVIESVREIEKPGTADGAGAAIGGIAGGLLGHQTGNGRGRDVMTVLGAIGGAIAGHEIQKNVNKVKSYEIDIRFDDGTTQLITQNTPPVWRMGDRVKLVNGVITAG